MRGDTTALGARPTSVRKRRLHAAVILISSGNHGDPPSLPRRRPRMPHRRRRLPRRRPRMPHRHPRLPRRHLHAEAIGAIWFHEDDALGPARLQVI